MGKTFKGGWMEIRGWIDFPKDFLWGTATAAYQIEGAHNVDGKGESIWDDFCKRKGKIKNKDTGDVACNHYYKYLEDLDLMKSLHYPAYRFSISWTRIFPEGKGRVNQKGLDFYKKLIDGLLERNIVPFVTLYHWDLPLALEKNGGWLSRDTARYFADYSEIVVTTFQDRVKYWITLNEPWVVTVGGYVLGMLAPGKIAPFQSLKVAHHLLLAHGYAVERVRAISSHLQVGITNALSPIHSKSLNKFDKATIRANALNNDLWLEPIFYGQYPKEIEKQVFSQNKKSPVLEDLKIISQKIDFLGINNYTRTIVTYLPFPLYTFRPIKPDYPHVQFTSMDWEVYPRGIYEILKYVKEKYGNPNIYITENGVAFWESINDQGEVLDENRIQFLKAYLSEVSHAIHEGVNVQGYFVWSFLDNFEWAYGYEKTFGLVYVNRKENYKRIPKKSAYWYSEVCLKNGFYY